ncbi:MAG: hypothetical protein Fur006_64240 [Coleofasciculaceae cyanobacterium]
MSKEDLRQQITEVASRFQIFQCQQCAEAIKQFLIEQEIPGKQIKLYTGSAEDPYSNIYHEILQQTIATNGQHQGIAVKIGQEELIFDNIDCQGIPRKTWLNNLYYPIKDFGDDFQITETDF